MLKVLNFSIKSYVHIILHFCIFNGAIKSKGSNSVKISYSISGQTLLNVTVWCLCMKQTTHFWARNHFRLKFANSLISLESKKNKKTIKANKKKQPKTKQQQQQTITARQKKKKSFFKPWLE